MTTKQDKTQSARFIEAARQAETDDTPEEFERVFGKIVPSKKACDIAAPRSKEPDRNAGRTARVYKRRS